ncbi:amidohydrolase family protein [Cohnella massiliensis]|uniref:amidohydrolase family protein n=1 Tax=Cohnella massiliensis TaxID=1816691 RepID=UPI0009BC6F32|nr:amidohydrolase family protein [Cohnella massiliensis]
MRIDAHQHYWKIDRGDYGWITPDIPLLYRDFLPGNLLPSLRKHGLDGTILVQAAPTLAETDYLLSLADGSDSILGVVGWLDLADDRCFVHYDRFARHPKFVGFRIMIQDMPDASRILEPAFVERLKTFEKRDVPVDLLLVSGQLEPVIRLIEKVPGLRGVVDHIAKPNIAAGAMEPWAGQMRRLASFPNLYCKLSGMVTEAEHRAWKPEQFVPYIRHAIDCFGENRVMFGSDWPVCLLAAEYDEVMEVLVRALPGEWGERQRAKLFGGNAAAFYKLDTGG